MAEAEKVGTILVVDDEPMNIMVLRGLLGHAGYAVESALNGPEGLEKARSLRPDMVLLDVMMPGESGFETCKKLKGDSATAHIPVIFITCLDEMSNKLAGLDLGAVDYITKPFMAAEVVARVRSHMNFQRRQSEIIDAQATRLGQVHNAQMSLLVKPEALPEARFAVHFLPVLEAGGDFYDVLSFGGGQTAYFLADVSGHDLGASFITSSLKALFRQHASQGKSPAEILSGMNRILCAITTEEVYLTAVCLCLDRFQGRYSLASGGHPPVVGQLEGSARMLDISGLPLGMFEDAEYAVLEGGMAEGDRFYLYTDGLAENTGAYVTSQAFRSHLLESCLHNAIMPLSAAVVNMVRAMTGEEKPTDDVVLLGVDV
ncbi:MAG TPA: SpoIIE family protein phosphatase [Humidesulfovibrio sp.]|uniref:PP2C family protein-serine/threonine phosphatase n=1 Tax=Humidesulfovibrio sp. TaxID=2910988 RepID=UPI002CEBDB90|nr:SpoIIE family protein phosphatase [Humidesulfovibrio sp.]HWR02540.1 SpoIIE family protein phosphatase [Humidesulfovibrio sp.]